MTTKRDTIYFISDAHFGISIEGDENRDQQFCTLTDSIKNDASDLFILGDLFDFWIDYKHAIRPDYFLILHELRKLVEAGIKVHYLAGNHDFALGPFLKETVGVAINYDTLDITLQGKKVHLFHGDGILKGDVGYRVLKRLLRNKFYQKMYKLLHPDIGVGFGVFCSGSSRKYTSKLLTPSLVEEYRSCAFKTIRDGGYDIVLYGHTHHGEIVYDGDTIYCNTGAWLLHRNYATLKAGELSLWQFSQDSHPKKVSPIDLKSGLSVS
ncbi:UDP-2,3-diacylglucosamine diphosphatase [Chitinispirillales bacterium ANBcel5]|uniref:UDP-2,3-diacylglucosamine diphosphatase n=1 Tax=Cellulosispirillum alkaliphilum TaxID=3039283 RepID=UPI002A58486D|nr:UDP-2,3-diacylglucosamine diphosphatase [Chitinispirillales bacterium ANBcel5]